MKQFLARKSSLGALRCITVLVLFLLITACNARQEAKESERYVLLGLVGYNYTNRYISIYSVDGADGGHINLSSATSGGSGVTCCVRLSKRNLSSIKVKVRWQVDGCVYLIKDGTTAKADKVRHFYYKEAEVDVEPGGQKPNYLEAHFFEDGTVKVRLTEYGSDPLVVLNEKRPEKSQFPNCKDDKDPSE
jgi:hypothetical protein